MSKLSKVLPTCLILHDLKPKSRRNFFYESHNRFHLHLCRLSRFLTCFEMHKRWRRTLLTTYADKLWKTRTCCSTISIKLCSDSLRSASRKLLCWVWCCTTRGQFSVVEDIWGMCDVPKRNGTKKEDLQYLASIIKVRVGFRQEKPQLPLGVSQTKSKYH